MNRQILSVAVSLLLVVAACASQPDQPHAPEVTLTQIGAAPDMTMETASGMPMQFQLKIVNPLDQDFTLVSVEMESIGESGAYGMKRVRHAFDRAITAKSSDTVDIRAWVYPLQQDMRGNYDSPVMLRGTARFKTATGMVRRNFVNRGQ